ncbi:hypothetical protein, partial [Stenotrophomonas maltophilia]
MPLLKNPQRTRRAGPLLRTGTALGLLLLSSLPASLPALAETVFPPGSRFGFEAPSDMSVSRRFTGFERREGGATVS